jgi:hypothetical protein
VFFDIQGESGTAHKGLTAHAAMNQPGHILSRLRGMAGRDERKMTPGGQVLQPYEHVGHLVGAVNIDLAPEDGLQGIDIDEARSVPPHFFFQERKVFQGKVLLLAVCSHNVVEYFDVAHLGPRQAQPFFEGIPEIIFRCHNEDDTRGTRWDRRFPGLIGHGVSTTDAGRQETRRARLARARVAIQEAELAQGYITDGVSLLHTI